MKYMGSKNRISKDILPIILKNRKDNQLYVELFSGGMNLIDKVDGRRLANDKNKYLIEMWKGLTEDVKRFYIIPKEVYSLARDDYNNKTNSNYSDFTIGWIGWMASYNGRFFDGGYSGHCVGKSERDYISEQIRNTEKQIDSMKGVTFSNIDYKDFHSDERCLIYCDIPYKDTKQYSTSKGFDHDEFWEWCRVMSSKHDIFISEYNAPEDFETIWEKQVTNSMNTTKTYKPTEKLFRYKK